MHGNAGRDYPRSARIAYAVGFVGAAPYVFLGLVEPLARCVLEAGHQVPAANKSPAEAGLSLKLRRHVDYFWFC